MSFLNDGDSLAHISLCIHDQTAFMCSLIYFTTIPDAPSVTLSHSARLHAQFC